MCHRRTSPTLFESTPLRTHQRHFHPGRAVRLSDEATVLFFAGWRWQCCIPRSADLKLPMSNVSNCLVILLRFWPKASSWNLGGRTSRQNSLAFVSSQSGQLPPKSIFTLIAVEEPAVQYKPFSNKYNLDPIFSPVTNCKFKTLPSLHIYFYNLLLSVIHSSKQLLHSSPWHFHIPSTNVLLSSYPTHLQIASISSLFWYSLMMMILARNHLHIAWWKRILLSR